MLVKVENNRSELLRHPLVTSLLNHKWSQFGAWIYFSNLLFYLIYVFFLTAFGLTVPNPQSHVCESILWSHTYCDIIIMFPLLKLCVLLCVYFPSPNVY